MRADGSIGMCERTPLRISQNSHIGSAVRIRPSRRRESRQAKACHYTKEGVSAMRIKVRDQWYDGNEEIVMIELTDDDKRNINSMHPDCTKYAQWPGDSMTEDQVNEFMEISES
jgi:hypothetical protein